MAAHTLRVFRVALPVLAAVTALLLAPAAAEADPPALDQEPCAALLAGAATWPGGFETPTGTVRLVSDAYVTHLSSQPACASASEE
jgi:hypothetical protein